jgi:hypothetical protein
MLLPWQSPALRRLLATNGVKLEGYPRADAYVALSPTLSKVVLPMGVADLARNIPPADVPLLAVEVSLVVSENMHPAVQYKLLEAATEVHSLPDVFHRAGRYPAAQPLDLPLSPEAREYFKSGLPLVYRYLPSWMAGPVERLLILIIPLFTIILPLVNFVPTLYSNMMQRRVFSLYGELKVIEEEIESRGPENVGDDTVAALEDLARRANHLKVPLGHAQRLFIVKSHIGLAQEKIEKAREEKATGSA